MPGSGSTASMEEMSTRISENELPDTTIILNSGEWERDTENTPVYTVISTVADIENTDPVEQPPLYEAIDPEALNDLLTARSEPGINQVSFQYAGYTIVVRGDGEVQVRPSTA